MPPSLVRPEETYPAFETDETFTSVAKRFSIQRPTLRRWWEAKFGVKAFEDRNLRVVELRVVSPEVKKQRRRVYLEENKDRVRETKRRWVEANPDRNRATKQRGRSENREAYNAYCRDYYAKNKETILASRNLEPVRSKHQQWEKSYYREHPEKLLLKFARKRAKAAKVPFSITEEDVLSLIPEDGCCPITGKPLVHGEGKVGPQSMTLDRVIPSLGYVPGNVMVISHLANTIKQNCTDPQVFRRVADYLESFLTKST